MSSDWDEAQRLRNNDVTVHGHAAADTRMPPYGICSVCGKPASDLTYERRDPNSGKKNIEVISIHD